MRRLFLCFTLALVAAIGLWTAPLSAQWWADIAQPSSNGDAGDSGGTDGSTATLVESSDFTYVGAFRLPTGSFGTLNDSFGSNGGFVMGNVYDDPINGKSLIIGGHKSNTSVSPTPSWAQIVIPSTIADPFSVGVARLTRASSPVQGFGDPSLSDATSLGAQIIKEGYTNGMGAGVVYDGMIIGTENSYYDARCRQKHSAWVGSVMFSLTASGPYGFTVGSPRNFGGQYMALVPSAWQDTLGGDVVMGAGSSGIASCGTLGPGLAVIDGATLAAQPAPGTYPATALLNYPCPNGDGASNCRSRLGRSGSGANAPGMVSGDGVAIPTFSMTDPSTAVTYPDVTYFDSTSLTRGVVIPDGRRSVLFIGVKGLGRGCYGNPNASNPPDPVIPADKTGTDASTSADGLTVTVPNQSPVVGQWIALLSQTTPNLDDNSPNLGHPGVAKITAVHNAGAASASVTVNAAFPGSLTSQSYNISTDLNCYDTSAGGKGQHAFPYVGPFVWAYDINDLAAVRAGTKQPWEVQPYGHWLLPVYGGNDGHQKVAGVAWDSGTRRLYVVVPNADGPNPLVQVFTIGSGN
jgi:hypothetical protein